MELAALRKSLNLTQAEFARELDVSPSLIEKVEMGNRRMSLGLAKRVEVRFRAKGFVAAAVTERVGA